MNLNVLITGGTGLIGQHLSKLLRAKGCQVRHLSRSAGPNAEFPAFKWDIKKGYLDPAALENLHYVIHLAGAGLTTSRWTAARKKVLIDSRVEGTKLLVNSIAQLQHKPKAFISASAIGYYGDTGDRWIDETAPPEVGDFKSECCVLWEEATSGLREMGIRLAKIRIGIVLDAEGGALAEMMASLKFGIAAYFGNGSAFYSWIHRHDMARLLVFAMENDLHGTFNAVAPSPARNKELMRLLVKARGKWALLLPAPAFVLKLVMGEMSAIVLDSNRISCGKIQEAGFVFEFPDLEQALVDLCG